MSARGSYPSPRHCARARAGSLGCPGAPAPGGRPLVDGLVDQEPSGTIPEEGSAALDPPATGSTVRLDLAHDGELRLEIEALRIAVVDGPDAGTKATLEAVTALRIGTDPSCDMVLTDPSVSRVHAELRVVAEGIRVRDLGSRNGIFVGSVRLEEGLVPPGEQLRLGATRLLLDRRVERRRSPVRDDDHLGPLVGRSPPMQRLYALLRALAPSTATALIMGESGTGKELVARAIHDLSGRKGPLVVFDAATTDKELMRGDLFGHTEGAFTGAVRDREGAFRKAEGGTLFIDELGELPLELQPRLLRALESREVTPLGSDETIRVDVRVLAATNRDLEAMAEEGAFRLDLYHRFAVIPVQVPPLRDRSGDVPLLVDQMLASLGATCTLTTDAREALVAYPWPGNVRQLRNVLERVSVLRAGQAVTREDLGLKSTSAAATEAPGGATRVEDMERRMILEALERTGGNKSAAARELGISLGTLRRRLKDYRVGD